jgi:hypothetical protein
MIWITVVVVVVLVVEMRHDDRPRLTAMMMRCVLVPKKWSNGHAPRMGVHGDQPGIRYIVMARPADILQTK